MIDTGNKQSLNQTLITMSKMYYLQPCPICGRRLQVRIEHIGRDVECVHCAAVLLAQDPEMAQANNGYRRPAGRFDVGLVNPAVKLACV